MCLLKPTSNILLSMCKTPIQMVHTYYHSLTLWGRFWQQLWFNKEIWDYKESIGIVSLGQGLAKNSWDYPCLWNLGDFINFMVHPNILGMKSSHTSILQALKLPWKYI